MSYHLELDRDDEWWENGEMEYFSGGIVRFLMSLGRLLFMDLIIGDAEIEFVLYVG